MRHEYSDMVSKMSEDYARLIGRLMHDWQRQQSLAASYPQVLSVARRHLPEPERTPLLHAYAEKDAMLSHRLHKVAHRIWRNAS